MISSCKKMGKMMDMIGSAMAQKLDEELSVK
jgi:hypothetical protein